MKYYLCKTKLGWAFYKLDLEKKQVLIKFSDTKHKSEVLYNLSIWAISSIQDCYDEISEQEAFLYML